MESSRDREPQASDLAPIALFCFKRPGHLARVLEALRANHLASESTLYLFCDGPRSRDDAPTVEAVRQVAHQADGFAQVEVRCADVNLGLARSIIAGVTEVVGRYGRVIVLEDDLITAPFFLTYMNEALRLYESVEAVASIHGYRYPLGHPLPETFFLRGADCWGWGTWARSWAQFQEDGAGLLRRLDQSGLGKAFDLGGAYPYRRMLEAQIAGRNDSWAIRWHATVFLNGGLTLYPGRSLVRNIGNDASGTHSRNTESFDGELSPSPIRVEPVPIEACREAETAFSDFFRQQRGGVLKRLARGVLRWWRP